jgi:hypothetical protein
LSPVALLSQALAVIIGVEADYLVPANGAREAASQVTRRAASLVGTQADSMNLEFAARPDQATVSLLLAESQIRIRLAPDLLLRCEVSSRDEANADAELKFELGVHFKFK